MTTRGAEPAYPVNERNDDGSHHHTHKGATLRELIAAMAMQGLLAGGYHTAYPGEASEQAVLYADSLLVELERGR